MTMKQCHECKAHIPSAAKRCMHCGKKQGIGFFGGTIAFFFTLMVIGIVAVDVSMPTTSDNSGPEAASAPAKPDPEVAAQSACVDALRQAARYPGSIEFSLFTDPPQAMLMNDGSYMVRVDFSGKNGFGNMVPMAGHCTVMNGEVTVVEADPR